MNGDDDSSFVDISVINRMTPGLSFEAKADLVRDAD